MIRQNVGETITLGYGIDKAIVAKVIVSNSSERFQALMIELEQNGQKIVMTDHALETILLWAKRAG